MDEYTMNNWKRVKEGLEAAGATGNYFYQRACAIVSGQPDPLDINSDKPEAKND